MILSGDRLKHHTENIKEKYENDDFKMNQMEEMSKIFSISCNNEDTVQGNIKPNINNSVDNVYTNF